MELSTILSQCCSEWLEKIQESTERQPLSAAGLCARSSFRQKRADTTGKIVCGYYNMTLPNGQTQNVEYYCDDKTPTTIVTTEAPETTEEETESSKVCHAVSLRKKVILISEFSRLFSEIFFSADCEVQATI